MSVQSGRARASPRPREPLAQVPWDEIETEMGASATVVLSYVVAVVVRWLVRSDSGRRRGSTEADDA